MSDAGTAGRAWSFRPPRSALLKAGITKSTWRTWTAQGMFPARSIWIPGSANDRPDIGDVFGPDEEWQPAQPILSKAEVEAGAAGTGQTAAQGGERW